MSTASVQLPAWINYIVVPILVLYVIFQRKFISGMLAGAVKE